MCKCNVIFCACIFLMILFTIQDYQEYFVRSYYTNYRCSLLIKSQIYFETLLSNIVDLATFLATSVNIFVATFIIKI